MSRARQVGRNPPRQAAAKKIRKLINKAVEAQRHGGRDQAARLYERVLALNPGNGDALHLLGLIEFERGRIERATRLIGEAIGVNPGVPIYHYNLAVVHRAANNDATALTHLRKALASDPDHRDALEHAALASLSLGETVAALEYIVRLLRIDPHDGLAQQWLEEALTQFPAEGYNRSMCELLQACYTGALLKPRTLALLTARQLALRYEIKSNYAAATDFRLPPGLNRDPLFLDFLVNGFNCVPEMELFLTDLRSHFLQSASETESVSNADIPLLAALCLQCFNNEYVFALRGQEADLLNQMLRRYEKSIDGAEVDWKEVEMLILVLGMFMPASELPRTDKLAARPLAKWQFCVQFVLQRQLLEPLEEAMLRERIPQIKAVDDRVSRVVQATYERYPYPRWTSLPKVTRSNYSDWLRSCYPDCTALRGRDRLDTLVAGCGTGQHPITLATRFSGLDVTAIDLSTTSLAYARRMANLHGADDIRFLCCDILDVGALDRKFDLIESVGVLHHMEDPAAGLRALLCVLKPGGILKLGLYSELAREDVNHVRTLLPAALNMSDEQIRALRYGLLGGLQTGERSSLYEIRDFYTLNECRDLLFHPQEHQFTMVTLKRLLEALDLEFLGFELGEQQRLLYTQKFPNDKNRTDLDNWNTVEQGSPRLFRGMYQFHVTPRKGATVKHAA
jgi:SAM-dependent methyltransferase/tetratricopeptide (TPR) repeat protein